MAENKIYSFDITDNEIVVDGKQTYGIEYPYYGRPVADAIALLSEIADEIETGLAMLDQIRPYGLSSEEQEMKAGALRLRLRRIRNALTDVAATRRPKEEQKLSTFPRG